MSQTTTTTGYFNGNKYRITINSNALPLNVTLEPGEFVRERSPDGKSGRQINDPRLDRFLQPNGLAKQLGDPVPLVTISEKSYEGVGISFQPAKPQPQPIARPLSPTSQVQRAPSNVLITDRKAGGVMPPRPHAPNATNGIGFSGGPVKPTLPGVTPPGINSAVKAMAGAAGVKQAEEAGIIGRARAPLEGVSANDGLTAKDAPYADDIGTPGQQRRLTEGASPAQRQAQPPQRVTITTPIGKEPTPVVLTDLNATQIPESDVYGALPDPVLPPIGGAELLGRTDAGVLDEASFDRSKPFVCEADGKAFSHYSSLQKHVKKNFPLRLEELTAPYKAR